MVEHKGPRLGIDVGGSKILALVVDEQGRVVGKTKKRTKPDLGYEAVLQRIRSAADGALEQADLTLGKDIPSLGIGLPGPVSKGIIHGAVNLGWKRKDIAKDLSRTFEDLPVQVGNDVNYGALGEAIFGVGRDAASAGALFMGTGLGGALVLDGKVLAGAHGFAGEIGHIPAPFDQAQCTCGQIGCIETVASKVGMNRLLREGIEAGRHCAIEDIDDLRSSKIAAAVTAEDPLTLEVLDTACRGLAWAVVTLYQTFDPEVVIFGGGVIESVGDVLLPKIQKHVANYSYHDAFFESRLLVAELGGKAVAMGAAVAGGLARP